MKEKEIITAPKGGRRQALGERWDMIPGGWQSLSEVSAVSHYGNEKHGPENWKKCDPASEQSPLNHGIAHAYKSLEFPAGSDERIRQLAKAAWNMLAAVWFEKQGVPVGIDEDIFMDEKDLPGESKASAFFQSLLTHRG